MSRPREAAGKLPLTVGGAQIAPKPCRVLGIETSTMEHKEGHLVAEINSANSSKSSHSPTANNNNEGNSGGGGGGSHMGDKSVMSSSTSEPGRTAMARPGARADGWFFFADFLAKFAAGIDRKLAQLERVGSADDLGGSGDALANDSFLLQTLWEDYPRRCAFFVGGMRTWLALPPPIFENVLATVLEWAAPPFSTQTKFPNTPVGESQLVEILWSRCAGDILVHLLRYASDQDLERDWSLLENLALQHAGKKLLNASASAGAGTRSQLPRDVLSRVLAQTQIVWASVLGLAAKKKPALITHIFNARPPFSSWQFVDLSLANAEVTREVLAMLSDQLGQPKVDKASRLVMLLALEPMLEKLDFQRLAERDAAWANVFKEVVARLFKTAESLAKTEELKPAALSVMLTILTRAPQAFNEANYTSFFSRRVLRHLSEPRKVTHSLENILRSLRSHRYARPAVAWDAFETYSPLETRFRARLGPFSRVSTINRRALESIYTEVFERSKSKAFASLSGSSSFGGMASSSNGPLASSISASAGAAPSSFTAAQAATPPPSAPPAQAVTRDVSAPSVSSLVSVGSHASLGSVGSIASYGSTTSFSKAPSISGAQQHGFPVLPKNLAVCKHILLQLAAHDMTLLRDKALPFITQLPDDLNKCPQVAANRAIVGIRALWDVLGPGTSVFRETAFCLHHGQSDEHRGALQDTLKLTRGKFAQMLQSMQNTLGTDVMGQAEHPLVPTLLWDSSIGVGDAGARGLRDAVGDMRGYPFAWADPGRGQMLDAFSFTSNGLVLELQQLQVHNDLFEGGNEVAFRARNLTDKYGAERQIAETLRMRAVFFKKRVNPALDVFRELIYAYPLLSCSPVADAAAPAEAALLDVTLLLHADWFIASAVSHALQRIMGAATSETLRVRVLHALAHEASRAVSRSGKGTRAVLTYVRQLALLLRLWVHLRESRAKTEQASGREGALPELDEAGGEPLLTVAIALLTFPCASVRMHSQEIIEAVQILWPHYEPLCKHICAALRTHCPLAYQCALKTACSCGAVSSEAEIHRRRTADDIQMRKALQHPTQPTQPPPPFALPTSASSPAHPSASPRQSLAIPPPGSGGKRRAHERSSTADGSMRGSPLSLDALGKTYTLPSPSGPRVASGGAPTQALSNGSSNTGPSVPVGRPPLGLGMGIQTETLAKGSTAPFEGAFEYVDAKGTPLVSRDELFLWYKSTGVVTDGLDPRTGAGRSDQWADELVKLTRALVACTELHETLHRASQILVEWLSRLAAFHVDANQVLYFEAVLRKSAVSFVLGVGGTSASLHASPLRLEPTDATWPGEMEVEAENLIHDLWDAAARIRPVSPEQAALRRIVLDLVGKTVHPRCISRIISLSLMWRQTRLTAATAASRNLPSEEKSKFGKFSRRHRGSENAIAQMAAYAEADTASVDQVCCSTLRIVLGNAGPEASFAGWEPSLRAIFECLSTMAQSDRLRTSEWTVTLEFTRLALQSARSLKAILRASLETPLMMQRADQIWLRAERRRIWKLMQCIVGFDDVKIFTVQVSNASPRASVSEGMGGPGVSSPSSGIAGRSIMQGNRQVISEANFKMLRELATDVGVQMLHLGPTALGTVAPRPDEMLWAWFYNDGDRSRPDGYSAPLLRNYLVAHWHVGDVEAAGGGTFGPFVERWFEEIQKLPETQRRADAIFGAFADAVDAWLFRGPERKMIRPLEPSAIAVLALLALVQTATHPLPELRARAFGLLDVVERSDSWAALATGKVSGESAPFELHSASLLGQQVWATDARTIEQTATQASIILADRCPGLGPSVLSMLCSRLSALETARLGSRAVQTCLAFAQSSSTRIVAHVSAVPDNFLPDTPPRIVFNRKSRSNSARGVQPSAEASELSAEGASGSRKKLAHGTMELQMRQSVQKDIRRAQKTHFNLEELWACVRGLVREEHAASSLDLVLPLWRAFCQHHASTVVDFLLARIIENSGSKAEVKQQKIATFFLTSIAPDIFAASPNIIVNSLVLGVLYRVQVGAIARGLFANAAASPSARRPRVLQAWIQLALTQDADPRGYVTQTDDLLEELRTLVRTQSSVVRALTLCAAGARKLCSMAFPQLISFGLCSAIGLHTRTQRPRHRTAGHECIAMLLRSLAHERLVREASRETSLDPALAMVLPARLLGPSPARVAALVDVDPALYTDEDLGDVVASMVELLTLCSPDGDLLHLWCQCLLLNALGVYQQQMLWKPHLLQRALAVYTKLRTRIEGPLYLVRGFAEVDESVAWRIEILALLRVGHQAMYNEAHNLVEDALSCLSQLDLRHVPPSLCKFALNLYATVANTDRTEELCLDLLLSALPEDLDASEVCVDALRHKIQDRATSQLLACDARGEDDMAAHDQDPSALLSLCIRLFRCGLLRVDLISALLPILAMGGLAPGAYVADAVDHLDLPASLREALHAFIVRPADDELAQAACVASMDLFGTVEFASGLAQTCARQTELHEGATGARAAADAANYTLASFRMATCVVNASPPCLQFFMGLLRMAASLDSSRSAGVLGEAAEELLKAAHAASTSSPAFPKPMSPSYGGVQTAWGEPSNALGAAKPAEVQRGEALRFMHDLIRMDACDLEDVLSPFMVRSRSPVTTPRWRRRADPPELKALGSNDADLSEDEMKLSSGADGSEPWTGGSSPGREGSEPRTASSLRTSTTAGHDDASRFEEASGELDEFTIGGVASFELSKNGVGGNAGTRGARRSGEQQGDGAGSDIGGPMDIDEGNDDELNMMEDDSEASEDDLEGDEGRIVWGPARRYGRTAGTIRLVRYRSMEDGAVSEQQSAVMRRSFLEELLTDESNHKQIETFIVQQPTIDTSWLEFALAVIDYKRAPSLSAAESVYNQFIVLDGLDTVDVPDQVREGVALALEAKGDVASKTLFDEGLKLALEYLDKHFLGRYLRSSQYCEA